MNVYKLEAAIGLNSSEYQKGLSACGDSMAKMGDKIKAGAAAIGKATAAGLAAGAAGATALTKSVVSAYADYEQLVGGVEKLFGESSDLLMLYAKDAYKTAGMSVNAYMETVTGFSAALTTAVKAAGGSMDEAVEYADTAMQDMSDNANTFGTDIASIQTAYQGFAKQNYTMLDNLKLGYGGTKAEMERLIEDANKLRRAQGINSNLTIESYADIITAIHEVQTEMKITGTTSREASKTISGSINSAKAAWKNLVIEMGKDDGDIGAAFSVLGETVGNVADNLLPRIEQALGGIGGVITAAAPQIKTAITQLLPKIVPSLLKTSVSLASSVGTAVLSTVPDLLDMGRNMLANLAYSLENSDFDGFGVFTNVFDSIFSNLPYYAQYAEMIISNLANKILDVDYGELASNIGTIITTGINSITNLIDDIDWEKVGKDAADFVNNIPWGEIADKAIECLEAAIKNIPELAKSFFTNIDGDNLMDGIAVIASVKLLKGIKAAFSSNSECQTQFSGIGSVMNTKLEDLGKEGGASYATAFISVAGAAIAGWKAGTKIREDLEEKYGKENTYEKIGGAGWGVAKALVNKLTGASAGKKEDENSYTYTNKYGQKVTIKKYDMNGGYTDEYIKATTQGPRLPAYGNGGRVTEPTLAIIGEKEPETIIPDSKRGQFGNVTYNVTFNVDGYSIKDDASFIEQMSRKLEELRIKQSRAMGGAAW